MNTLKRFLIWPFRMVFNVIRWVFMAVLGSITWVLQTLWRTVMWIATIPKMLWRGVVATYHILWSSLCTIGRGCIAVPVWLWHKFTAMIRAILRSPRQTYEKCRSARDWLLAKVEHIQSESQKWKTTFNILKSPYTLLRAFGLSPQLAVTFLFAGTAVGGGAIVAEVMEPPSFSRGDSGVYAAPQDAPVFFAESFNTLRVDLGSTAVGNITIEDTTLGTAYTGSTLPSGETSPIIIGGKAAVVDPAFTETFLETSYLLVDRWRCESLLITNSEANKLIVTGMVSDGQSLAPVPGTPRMRAINGGNRAADMHSHDSYFDQLRIQASTSGVNGKVDVLTLSNLYSKGGSCLIDRVKANVMEIRLGEIGGDSDLATKAFQIADTVTYKSFEADGNVEVAMAVPAIQ